MVSRATGIPVSQLTRRSATGCSGWRSGSTSGWSARTRRWRPSPRPCAVAGPGSATRSARGELPVPRADRRRQDGAREGARRGPVRRRGPDGPVRHERVPGAAHREPARRGAARVRRLRGGRAAHRGGPAQAVLGGAARRDREGAPRRVQPPAAGPGRRTAHRRPGPHGGLQEHRRDHDEQPRRRTDPGARSPQRGLRGAEGGPDAAPAVPLPAGVPQPDRRDHRLPGAHQGAGHPDHGAAPGPGPAAPARAADRADVHAGGRGLHRRSRATTRSSAPARCRGRSSGSWRTRCPGCCWMARSPRATP